MPQALVRLSDGVQLPRLRRPRAVQLLARQHSRTMGLRTGRMVLDRRRREEPERFARDPHQIVVHASAYVEIKFGAPHTIDAISSP